MKKFFTFLCIMVAFVTLQAQDTIYPFEPGQPLSHDTLGENVLRVFYSTGSVMGSFYEVVEGVNLTAVNLDQCVVTGLVISFRYWPYRYLSSYNYDSDTVLMRGVIATVDSDDYAHPHFYVTRIRGFSSAPSWGSTTLHDCYVGLNTKNACEEEKEFDTVLYACYFYFEEPIPLSGTVYVGAFASNPEGQIYPIIIHALDQCQRPGTIPILQYQLDSLYHPTFIGQQIYTLYPIIIPITKVPDTDSFGCPEVEGFGYAGMQAGAPAFVWDTAGEHEMYQVAYGPYNAPTESLRRVETNQGFLELFDNTLSTDVYYQARVRARCHHNCLVHDTVMWTAWSDPVYFYTGNHMPDTTHQPEGIHAPDAHQSESGIQFSIIPNPARNGDMQVVEIEKGVPLSGVRLTLHDAAGHEVWSMEVKEHRFALPSQGLAAGVYMATLSSSLGTVTRRVVIEK